MSISDLFNQSTIATPELPAEPLTGIAALFNSAPAITPPTPEPQPVQESGGLLQRITDVLSRGQYASAKFFDSLVNDSNSTLYSSLADAGQELLQPKSRLSFSDVIRHSNPEFAKDHPIATGALGFIGDVALDPVTWLTFGYGSELKLGKTGQILSDLGKKALGEEIAKQLPNVAKDAPSVFQAARDLAEPVIADAISAGRTDFLAKFKLFGIPVAKQGAIESGLKTFWEKAGVPIVSRAEKVPLLGDAVRFIEWLPKGFKATWQLPAEYLGKKSEYVADLANRARDVENMAKNTFVKLGQFKGDDIDKATRALMDAYDLTANRFDELKKAAFEALQTNPPIGALGVPIPQTVEEMAQKAHTIAIDQIRGESADLLQKAYAANKIDPKLQVLANAMRQDYMNIGKQMKDAGLKVDLVENYVPLIFDGVFKDKQKFTDYLRYVDNPFLPAGETRDIRTFEAARAYAAKETAKGKPISIETDGIKLFTVRALEAQKAIAWENFKAGLKGVGIDINKDLPKRIGEDLRFLGEGDFSKGMSDATRTALQGWDKLLNGFRKIATTIKIPFAEKQLVSNSLQSYLVGGAGALVDPRSKLDAMRVMLHLSGYGDAEKFLKTEIATTLGTKISGEDLIKAIFDNNIIRGENMGVNGVRRTADNIVREVNSARFVNKLVGPEWEGLAKVFKGFANYTNWPSIIEDFSRVNMFVNGVRGGLDFKTAAKVADDALFDYAHGLSQFERRLVRRIVPFYSFQRFMIPLIGQTLLTHPGRVANLEKVAKDFTETYSRWSAGEPLSNSERMVLQGNYLLDQPFAGMDKDRQAMFRVLNNFNPLDVMNIIEQDSQGNIDFKKTLGKAFLAQVAPAVKWPFELLANRNFFTDRAIAGEKSSGRIGAVTPEGVLSNIMAAVGANYGGLPGIAAGKAVGAVLPEDVAKWVMNATGWEKAADGKVYINPYLSYIATSQFPILNQAIRFDRNVGDHPFEKWLDLLLGVPTSRTNLREQAAYQIRGQQADIRALQQKVRMLFAQGRPDAAQQAQQDLLDLLTQLQARWSQINFGNIRG